MKDKFFPVWIVAVSINQEDIVECGRQVLQMGTIYDNATIVYSYVGAPAEDTTPALDFMKELIKHPMV